MASTASTAGQAGPAQRSGSGRSTTSRTSRTSPRTGASRAAASEPVRRSPVAELLARPLASYYLVLAATTMLLALGLVMVLSASSVESFSESGSSFSIFAKQLQWSAIGLPLMWVVSRLPVRAFRLLAWPALLATLVLLALVQVSPFGVAVNGNRNWLDFGGPMRLQPSEFAKLVLAVWGAHVLAAKWRLLDRWRHLLVPVLPASGLVVFLVLAGRDLGTVLVLGSVVAGLLLAAGAPMRLFVAGGAVAAAGLAVLVTGSDNRMSRMTAFLQPASADPEGIGYQLLHAKYALGSGGWFGLGLGASREKWGRLPEQQTDFIFAIIGEELGLVGTATVVLLFAALGYAGVRIATRSGDLFVRLAAGAVTVWLLAQATINLGAVLGVLPIIGLPLPLLSYGGSALLPTLLALGMLLAFARAEEDAAAQLAARRPRLRRWASGWPRRPWARSEGEDRRDASGAVAADRPPAQRSRLRPVRGSSRRSGPGAAR